MTEAVSVVVLVVVHLLLGANVWRWLAAPTVGAIDPPDRLDNWFAALSLAFIGTGWFAVMLAEAGVFSLVALIAIWVTLTGLAWWRGRRRANGPVDWGRWPARPVLLGLAVWLAVAGWLYSRPHEYVLGGADAGVYVNLGANIANTGQLLIHDELLAGLPPALYPVLMRALPATEATPYYLFPGFYVPGQPPGLILPQFYPFYPAWLAVAHTLGGVPASLLMAGLFGAWGALSLFLLARRLGGLAAGFLTLGGITLSGLQIWFSRYPTTETLAQALLWTGAWSLSIWWSAPDRRRSWGLLAGLAWGALMLTRIDMVFLLATPFVIVVAAGWQRRLTRSLSWFLIPFAVLAAHTLIHALWQSWPYFINTFGAGIKLLRRNPSVSIVTVLAILGAVGWSWLRSRGDSQPARQGSRLLQLQLPRLAAAGILLLTAYGWFIRPHAGGEALSWINWYAADVVSSTDRENLVRLGWYLSPVGIWLGAIGAAARVCRRPWRQTAGWVTLLALGGFFSLFYLWRLQNNPVHVYAMRRYVPAVMPFFILLAAWLIGQPFTARAAASDDPATTVRSAAGTGLRLGALALAILWLAGLGWGARGLVRQQDARGLTDQILSLADALPEESVLLFADPAPVGIGDFLGTPLQFLGGHHAFAIRDLALLEEPAARSLLWTTITGWQADGHHVYWVGDPGEAAAVGLATAPGQNVDIRTPVLEGSAERRPSAVTDRAWFVQLSEIVQNE